MLEKEGFRYRNYVDIFDGGPTLECDIDRVRAIRKSRLVEVSEGQPAPGDWPACLVSNENYANFRAMLVRTNPKCERLVLTAAELDALKCNAGVRFAWCVSALRRKQHDIMDYGDWVTGEGEERVKTNPVGKEVLWKGMTPAPRRWNQACRAARRRVFPAWAKQPFAVRQAIVGKVCRAAGGKTRPN